MREYNLAGRPYDLGRQNGDLLARASYPTARPPSTEQWRFALECQAIVARHTPWLLDEIRGVADSGACDPATATALPLTLYEGESGCSVVAVSPEKSDDGRPLFGRNYDFFASFATYSALYRTRAPGLLAHIGCSDHWVGRHDGLNEAGLAIAHSGPPMRDRRPGFVFTLAIRAVLDTCASVADACTLLHEIPHLGNSAFLVADATGDIAVVDVSVERAVATRPAAGFAFLTNRFVSPEMAEYSAAGDVPDSGFRERNVRRWGERRRRIEMRYLQALLSDGEHGVRACLTDDIATHDPEVTLWSWTAALGEAVLYLAEGSRANEGYEPKTLDA